MVTTPADVGGKFWVDKGGLPSKFNAANMNRLRPPGFVHQTPGQLLQVTIAPVRWLADSALLKTFNEATLTVAPNKTTFVYLDGSQVGQAQLTSNTTGFPSAMMTVT